MPAQTIEMAPARPKTGRRIAFLCGCLEPGADGVGDYTTLLAAACMGCATLRIALNDRCVTGAAHEDGALRLGAGMKWDERVEMAREAVARFDADLVSLQWVPYAFHPRGMSAGIARAVPGIAGGRAAHLMCHELWIGAEIGARLSHRLLGKAQRAILRAVVRALRPGSVQTSTAAYAARLRQAGIEAEVLPMFGAIPPGNGGMARDPGVARFGMFGQLHPEWRAEPLLTRLRELGRRIEIEHIGRIGNGEGTWAKMERRYGNEFGFKRHGEQPAERVSRFLTEMDFGIATTPLALIGKSASAAAMLEHGLPVIVNRDDVRYAGIDAGPAPPGVITMDEGLIDALRTARRREPRWRLPEVAQQFLQSMVAR